MMQNAITRSRDDKNVITLYHFFGLAAKDHIATLFRDLLGQLLDRLPMKPCGHIKRWVVISKMRDLARFLLS